MEERDFKHLFPWIIFPAVLVSAEQGQLGTLSHAGSRDLLLFASVFLAEKEVKSSISIFMHTGS